MLMRTNPTPMTDAEREDAILRAGKAIEKHMATYASTSCLSARGDADRARLLMQALIAGRSAEQVARMEAAVQHAVAVHGHALRKGALIGAGMFAVLGMAALCSREAREGSSGNCAIGLLSFPPFGAGVGLATPTFSASARSIVSTACHIVMPRCRRRSASFG